MDPFAFVSVQVPAEPPGKYQTVATLMRVAAWVAFAAGVLSLLGFAFFLLGGAFLLAGTGQPEGLLIGTMLAFRVVAGIAIAVVLMIRSGRALEEWADPATATEAMLRSHAVWVLLGGVAALILAGTTLAGLGLIGLGIALLVLGGDPEIWDALQD